MGVDNLTNEVQLTYGDLQVGEVYRNKYGIEGVFLSEGSGQMVFLGENGEKFRLTNLQGLSLVSKNEDIHKQLTEAYVTHLRRFSEILF